ncbi:hypothetical protein Aperf_G00000057601 [Anoplocephala perfoliata]
MLFRQSRGSARPCTSHGRLLATLPLVKPCQPPRHLLPPHPPPAVSPSCLATLPELPQRLSVKRTRSRYHPICSSKTNLIDASTDTWESRTTAFICRLCGIYCDSGDLLHAHLLLLQHNFQSFKQTRFFCRQCGASWFMDDEKRCGNHPCLLQKAAYFKNVMASPKHVKQGLPFVCLFCCAEADGEEAERPQRRQPRRVTRKIVPLKRWRASARFTSKLDLAIHIRYTHDPSRQSGHCPECQDFFCSEKGPPEIDFWQDPPSKSIRPSSTDSILFQEGLVPLEQHIKDIHNESYAYLEWLNLKHNRFVPRDLSERTSKSRTSWIYACPLCQLHPFTDHSLVNEFRAVRPEMGFPSNAALQAHISCFHPVSVSFIDWKLQSCSVCGEFNNTSSQYNHLLKQGHIIHLKQNFARALKQGRFSSVNGSEAVEWRNTCVLCWRRFGDQRVNLRAECRLQAHLLSTHCICKKESQDPTALSCGWCGDIRQKEDQNRSYGLSEGKITTPLQYFHSYLHLNLFF